MVSAYDGMSFRRRIENYKCNVATLPPHFLRYKNAEIKFHVYPCRNYHATLHLACFQYGEFHRVIKVSLQV